MSGALELPARVRFAQLPTPIEKLDRLTRHLGGPEIYVKRDDQTGLATGGNKARKLEFLVGDALRQGATTLVTSGAVQSEAWPKPPITSTRLIIIRMKKVELPACLTSR